MGGKKAPSPDPQMGAAAVLSAQTGQNALAFMQQQANITNEWALQDRARYQSDYVPMERQYAIDAQSAADPAKIGLNADLRGSEAVADVRQQFSLQADADNRRMRSMGVRPDSGRDAATMSSRGSAEALAAAGASNMARRQSIDYDKSRSDGMMANAINMGKGMAINPGVAIGLSNSAGNSGARAAMSGYGQQASILGQQYAQQMQSWEANQNSAGMLGSALGTLAGAFIPSSKKIKHDKQPFDALGAVRKMPVEKWTYNKGEGDGQSHVGPYAEDFHKATGIGDGKSVDLISQMGVTLGAVRQLSEEVRALKNSQQRKVA